MTETIEKSYPRLVINEVGDRLIIFAPGDPGDELPDAELEPVPGLDDAMRARIVKWRRFLTDAARGYHVITTLNRTPETSPDRMIATQANTLAAPELALDERQLREMVSVATAMLADRRDEKFSDWTAVKEDLDGLLRGLADISRDELAAGVARHEAMLRIVRQFVDVETDPLNPMQLTRIELIQILALLVAASVDLMIHSGVSIGTLAVKVPDEDGIGAAGS